MLPAVLGLFGAVGLAFLVASLLTGEPPWWFVLLWFVVVGWLAINGLYRTSYELKFDDAYLYWRGFLRSGKVRLSDVVAVEPEFYGSVAVFVCRDGQRIRVGVLQGLAPFLTALTEAHPTVGASRWWYATFVERAQLRGKNERTASGDASGRTADSEE
jgi:hypothetical protein